jgi:hypothetical protein
MVDEITGTSGGNAVPNAMTVALPEVPVGIPHQFTIPTLTEDTTISFRVRSKDNNGSYSSGVTVNFSGTTGPYYFGGRGLFHDSGNSSSQYHTNVDYVTISSTSDANDFGDLTVARTGTASCSGGGRGIFGCGKNTANSNIIDYVTISTTGNAIDFGDATLSRYLVASCSDGSRGLFAGGIYKNNIDYVTILTTGNAIDFGDLTIERGYFSGCSNGIRGLFGQGWSGDVYTNIDYVTISTTGNGTEFGSLSVIGNRMPMMSCSDGTKGLFAGGDNNLNVIDYVTISTTGNAIDFGDLTVGRTTGSSCSDGTKGLFAGGGNYISGSHVEYDIIDYVTISTTGNAIDFGNLAAQWKYVASCSGD